MKKLGKDVFDILIKKGKLKRLDVILVHSKKGLAGKLIRFGTKSYWNHVAIIFVVRNTDKGFDNTFIIESSVGGIDIHNFYDEYLAKPDKYDIGIKRFKAKWLNNDKNGLEIRKLIRGNLLNAIDAEYDYNLLLRIAKNILKNLIFFHRLIYNGIRGYKVRKLKYHKNLPAKYICSGYVQFSIFKVVNRLVKKKKYGLKKDVLNDIVVNPLYRIGKDNEKLLLSTTPADFAKSDKLEWKFIVKNNIVYKVNDKDYNELL